MAWTADQLSRLARLSGESVDLPPAARPGWLVQARAQHPDLAAALDAMQQAPRGDQRDTASTLPPLTLTRDAAHRPGADSPSAAAGDCIGPYRLLHPIGQGGMGTVWLAEQVDGRVHRQVALKLLSSEWAQPGWRLRFDRERDILAGMEHPGIARLIDAGSSASGQPYLAMALVPGQDIVRHVRAQGLDARACVGLMVDLLAAVQHAHALLVLHRDLKPSNILVDDTGRVVLLDFGIAKLVTPEPSGAVPTDVTAIAGSAMTLDYASPEQVAGRPVGVASDIYSAGVVLFELLAGQRPYRLRRASRAAMEEAILEQDLAPPSQRVDPAHAAAQGLSPRRVAARLRGDLDAIVLKALQRDPTQRYASADAFANDLTRWLEGRPVRAQGLSRGYVAWRWLQRHRWPVAGATLTLCSLATGLALAVWQAGEARAEARAARATEDFLVGLFRANGLDQDDPVQAQMTTARSLLERGSQRLDASLSDAPATRLRLLQTLMRLNGDLGLVDRVDQLAQQRLALWRQQHPREPAGLADVLIAAGRAAGLGNTHVKDANRLLDEAENALNAAGLPADAPQRGHLALARTDAVDADQCEALKHARQAVRLLRPSAATDPQWLDALIVASVSAANCGTGEEALALGQEALQALTADPAQRGAATRADHVHRALGLAYSRLGRPGDSIREARLSLQLSQAKHAPGQPPGTDVVNAAADLASKLRDYAHPAEALAVSAPMLARIATPPTDPDATVSLLIDHARALRELGRLDEALASLEQARALLPSYDVEPGQRVMLLDAEADIRSARGQTAAASTLFAEAARIHAELHHTSTPQIYPHLARLAQHELRRGQPDRAQVALDAFIVKTPEPGRSTRRYMERQVLLGELALARRHWTLAEAQAREALARSSVYPEPELARDLRWRALALLATALRAAGREAEARAPALEALALGRAIETPAL